MSTANSASPSSETPRDYYSLVIAHWINTYYHLKNEKQVDKNSILVVELKKWVDAEYESGRVTVLTDQELIREIERICDEKGITI